MKVKAKVAKKSLKYLDRTAAALRRLIKGEEINDDQIELPAASATDNS